MNNNLKQLKHFLNFVFLYERIKMNILKYENHLFKLKSALRIYCLTMHITYIDVNLLEFLYNAYNELAVRYLTLW